MDRFLAVPGQKPHFLPSQGAAVSKDDDSPPPAERRPKARQRVLLTGIVAYANGAHSFHCTIRNLSETGARLAPDLGFMASWAKRPISLISCAVSATMLILCVLHGPEPAV